MSVIGNTVVSIIHFIYELYQGGRRLAKTMKITHEITVPPKRGPKYRDASLGLMLRAYPAWVTEQESLHAIQLHQICDKETYTE